MMKKQNEFYAVFIITFIVAACSIIYELLFSQLLTIILGGTVVQYSLTIGTFLFFLGIGSLFYKRLCKNPIRDLVKVEIAISLISVIGIFLIPKIYSILLKTHLSSQIWIVVILAYGLVATIGFLSGLEIPLLVDITQKFENKKLQRFSEVLGVDYFGSLVGTVIYALVFFPLLGVFGTVIIVASLNLLVACVIAFYFDKKKHLRALLLILLFIFTILIIHSNTLQEETTKSFRAEVIFSPYFQTDVANQQLTYKVQNFFATPYQDVLEVDVYLNPKLYSDTPPLNYSCIYIDNSVQFCENEVLTYHGGLIDVPMRFFEEKTQLEVLIIGGGDYIGIYNLLLYPNVKHIDHVDIDGEFVEAMKVNPFVRKYHHDSYLSPKVDTKIEDGFTYVLKTQKTYDLIILDLPNVENDKILPLFSVEFSSNLYRILKEQGVVVSWVYDYNAFSPLYDDYRKVFHQNFYEAGFEHIYEYNAYSLTYNLDKSEAYNMFAKTQWEPFDQLNGISSYLTKTLHSHKEQDRGWRTLGDQNVRSNSIFHPNHNILVKT